MTAAAPLAMPVPQMIVGIITVIFNVLVLIVFNQTKSVKSTTVYLISYLAVSDICLGMCSILRSGLVLVGTLSWSLCTLLLDIILTSAGGSLTAILMMHLEVFASVRYVAHYRVLFTKFRVLVVIFGSIAFWAGVGVIGYVTTNREDEPATIAELEKICFPHAAFDPDYLIVICSMYIAFFILILVCQVSILRMFQRQKAKVEEQLRRPSVFSLGIEPPPGAGGGGGGNSFAAAQARSSAWMKRKLNLSKMLTVVLVMFVVCWYPYIIATLIFVACRQCDIKRDALSNLGSLILFHGILNLLVYIYKCKEFRVAMKRVMCCLCNKNPKPQAATRSNTSNRIGSVVN